MAKGNQRRVRGKPHINSLLEHYQPISGVVDEMVDVSGNPRPVWKNFIEALEDWPESSARCPRRPVLRDASSITASTTRLAPIGREWPLAHVPLQSRTRNGRHQRRPRPAGRAVRGDRTDIYGRAMIERHPAGGLSAERNTAAGRRRGQHGHFCILRLRTVAAVQMEWWVLATARAPSAQLRQKNGYTTRAVRYLWRDDGIVLPGSSAASVTR
jgi:hypothetical protein